jgi:hypothetical protein
MLVSMEIATIQPGNPPAGSMFTRIVTSSPVAMDVTGVPVESSTSTLVMVAWWAS